MSKRILVVEDQEDLRAILRDRYLQGLTFAGGTTIDEEGQLRKS